MKLELKSKIFKRLTVLEQVAVPKHLKNKTSTYWLCLCICGKEIIARGNQLVNGNTTSCGCFNIEQIKLYHSYSIIEDVKMASAKYIYRTGYNEDNISFNYFYELSQKNCYYCNSAAINSKKCYNIFKIIKNIKNRYASDFSITNGNFIYNGLDRINNNKQHSADNVITCCFTCNSFKNDLNFNIFIKNINNLKYNFEPIFVNNLAFIKNQLKLYNYKNIFQLFNIRSGGINNNYICTNKINQVKKCAVSRGYEFKLDNIQTMEIISFNCNYCNAISDPHNGIYNGIDRIDNNLGYLVNNCITCCKYCNAAKNNLSIDDFIIWIHNIKNYLPILLEKIKTDKRFINEI